VYTVKVARFPFLIPITINTSFVCKLNGIEILHHTIHEQFGFGKQTGRIVYPSTMTINSFTILAFETQC